MRQILAHLALFVNQHSETIIEELQMKLRAAQRNRLPKSEFGEPGKRSYLEAA